MKNFETKFPNLILGAIFILTLALNWFGRPLLERKFQELITGEKTISRVTKKSEEFPADDKDKNIRSLLEGYKNQGEFISHEDIYLLNYKGNSYIANKDILKFYSAKESLDIIFDSFTPVEVKKLTKGAKVRFLSYSFSDGEKRYGTEGISITLEIESKPLAISFLNFERIFIYPRMERLALAYKSGESKIRQICNQERLYPFSDIDYLITKKTKLVSFMKERSAVLNKIIGNYYFDIKEKQLFLCYAINSESEDEIDTLRANLASILNTFYEKS